MIDLATRFQNSENMLRDKDIESLVETHKDCYDYNQKIITFELF